MDPNLMALCLEVLAGNIDSDNFARLLVETGVNLDSYEWDVANKLLEKQDEINSLFRKFGNTVH